MLQLLREYARVELNERAQEHEHAARLLLLVQEKAALAVPRLLEARPCALEQLLEEPTRQLLEHQYAEVGLRLEDRAVPRRWREKGATGPWS